MRKRNREEWMGKRGREVLVLEWRKGNSQSVCRKGEGELAGHVGMRKGEH